MAILTETGLSQLATRLKDGTAFEALLRESFDPMVRNGLYRGRSLGTAVTDEQWETISAGEFHDLYIGDYWTIDDVDWRIAALDWFYNSGDTACTTHHCLIVPDQNIVISQQMNSSDTTEGGYIGSAMYTDALPDVLEICESAFGSSHILSHRDYFCNAVDDDGCPSGAEWCTRQVDLMSERMVYGSPVYQQMNSAGDLYSLFTIGYGQLPLFALNRRMISVSRAWYWLRDVVAASRFAACSYTGHAAHLLASSAFDVRPAFPISA